MLLLLQESRKRRRVAAAFQLTNLPHNEVLGIECPPPPLSLFQFQVLRVAHFLRFTGTVNFKIPSKCFPRAKVEEVGEKVELELFACYFAFVIHFKVFGGEAEEGASARVHSNKLLIDCRLIPWRNSPRPVPLPVI